MSTYVIGIGGTGSKVIESLIHISAAGLINPAEQINLFFVDADVANGNGNRTESVRDLYTKVQGIEGANLHRVKVGYKCDLNGNEIRKWTILHKDVKTLENLFAADFSRNNIAASLFKVLYSDKELKESLDKGFRGHPNIGSLVITQNLDLDQEPWNTLLKDISSEVQNGNVKLIIFGSVFGGTGAAGIPTISKILYEKFKDVKNVSLNVILMLPYFTFQNSNEEGLKAYADKFLENTRYALEFYHNEEFYDYYEKVYVIGNETMTQYPKPSLGGNEQMNPSLLPELLAALAIKDIIDSKDGEKSVNYINKNNQNFWADMPISTNDKNKLIQYLLYSLHYMNVYYPFLSQYHHDKVIPRSEAWAIRFFQNRSIDIFNDNVFNRLTDMKIYCQYYVDWIRDMFGSYSNIINTSLFYNQSSKIGQMNDLVFLLDSKLKKDIRYEKVYSRMNNYKLVNDSRSETGTFLNILYNECEV